jgi:hypothetical protein
MVITDGWCLLDHILLPPFIAPLPLTTRRLHGVRGSLGLVSQPRPLVSRLPGKPEYLSLLVYRLSTDEPSLLQTHASPAAALWIVWRPPLAAGRLSTCPGHSLTSITHARGAFPRNMYRSAFIYEPGHQSRSWFFCCWAAQIIIMGLLDSEPQNYVSLM